MNQQENTSLIVEPAICSMSKKKYREMKSKFHERMNETIKEMSTNANTNSAYNLNSSSVFKR
jgi:hypothetical protein